MSGGNIKKSGKRLDDFFVADGDSWSAGKALSVGFKVFDGEQLLKKEKFSNEWDLNVPYAQEWRDSRNAKFDFSDVTLDTPKEEIEEKKQKILENYQVPSQEVVQDAYGKYNDASNKFSKEVSVRWLYNTMITSLALYSSDYDKMLGYANKLLDNIVDNQRVFTGEKSNHESMMNIENPFATRFEKFFKRDLARDPLFIVKEGGFEYCDMGKNSSDFIKEVEDVKSMLPQSKEEFEKIDFPNRDKVFEEKFKERYTAHAEMRDAQKVLMGHIVQIDIRENYSKAFDKQLEEHMEKLEEQKKKEDLDRKKEEIKSRLAERAASKQKTPLSGVVVADIIAEHIRDKAELFEKDKARGIHGKDEKAPTMSKDESNEMARNIQLNAAQRNKDR